MGRRDVGRDLPVTRDTIFRIASLTKPVTSVAALAVLDEGRFDLDEPIARVAPELASLRVLEDPEGPLDRTVPAARAITFRDLLTHRSGLSYGEFHRGPIREACAEVLGAQIDNVLSPDEWIARLATLPLVDQPGAAFRYGISTDLLGFLLNHSPHLEDWERDVISILRDEAAYFAPQRRTKIANEGFASWVHNEIVQAMQLDTEDFVEFNRLNADINAVVRNPTVDQRMRQLGYDPYTVEIADAPAFFKASIDAWAGMIRLTGISAE